MLQTEAASLMLLVEQSLLEEDLNEAVLLLESASNSVTELTTYNEAIQLGTGFPSALASSTLEVRTRYHRQLRAIFGCWCFLSLSSDVPTSSSLNCHCTSHSLSAPLSHHAPTNIARLHRRRSSTATVVLRRMTSSNAVECTTAS